MYLLGLIMLAVLIFFIRYIIKSVEGVQVRRRWQNKKIHYKLELDERGIITRRQYAAELEKLIREETDVEKKIKVLEKRLSRRSPLFPPPQTDPDDWPMTWEEESNERHYLQQDLSELYGKSTLLSNQIRILKELIDEQR
jgi:hypothetical protein